LTSLSLRKKLALGTVQLGLPYGINNKTGKPNREDSFRILDCAQEHNIDTLDSADAYGDSIQVIGAYLKSRPQFKFKIISKFINDGKPLEKKLTNTLNDVFTDKLYGYMYHRFDDYRARIYREELLQLKAENKIDKIGASVYSVEELEMVVGDKDITLIQLPLNPFDTSSDKLRLLKEAKSLGKEIHVRSVFLQGLFFKKPDDLSGNLVELRKPLQAFHEILKKRKLNVRQACLNYALHQSCVNNVIVGVDTREQLVENVEAVLETFPAEVIQELSSVEVSNPSLLNPSNWKP